jgi:hypothetical protein
MKKESSKKLNLSKIKVANLNQVQIIKNNQAPTTTAVTSHLTLCYICPMNDL